MAFFSKLKERLFKSSSKLDEGLEAIVEDGGEPHAGGQHAIDAYDPHDGVLYPSQLHPEGAGGALLPAQHRHGHVRPGNTDERQR